MSTIVADEEGGWVLLTRRRLSVVKCASGIKPGRETRQSKLRRACAYSAVVDYVGALRRRTIEARCESRGGAHNVPYPLKARRCGSTLLPESRQMNPPARYR